jgi:hypothetical protein
MGHGMVALARSTQIRSEKQVCSSSQMRNQQTNDPFTFFLILFYFILFYYCVPVEATRGTGGGEAPCR